MVRDLHNKQPDQSTPTALLIIDVQKGHINRHTKHIPKAVEDLQKEYESVFVSKFINLPGSSWHRLLKYDKFSPGSEDTELAFNPKASALITERCAHSAIGNPLLKQLSDQKIEQVHLCGINIETAITQSAVDLFQESIRPIILSKFSMSFYGPEAQQGGLTSARLYVGGAGCFIARQHFLSLNTSFRGCVKFVIKATRLEEK